MICNKEVILHHACSNTAIMQAISSLMEEKQTWKTEYVCNTIIYDKLLNPPPTQICTTDLYEMFFVFQFFQWADSAGNVSLHHMGGAKIKLTDAGTVTSYFRQQHIMLYCHCQFLQKSMENILAHFKNVSSYSSSHQKLEFLHKFTSKTWFLTQVHIKTVSSNTGSHQKCEFLYMFT